MEINLVAEGLRFMVLGMVSVFSFLTLMVFILDIQSKILKSFQKTSTTDMPDKQNLKQTTQDDELVAVISAAIVEHKNNIKR